MSEEIVIVSGLPRSGTSLMMQMIDAGGIEVLTDRVRAADTDNPRGYFEFEQVKKIKHDHGWLSQARGRSFKMVSQLLYDLPPGEAYRVVFMERDFGEMIDSQEKMLQRLGRPAAPREQIAQSFTVHLARLFAWLAQQAHMQSLRVSYNALLEEPEEQARRVAEFLDNRVEYSKMAAVVDPALYRNRKPADGRASAASA